MNLPFNIYSACSAGETIDVATYVGLHTTIDLDGLLDILEMKAVHHSWAWAAMMNARVKDG